MCCIKYAFINNVNSSTSHKKNPSCHISVFTFFRNFENLRNRGFVISYFYYILKFCPCFFSRTHFLMAIWLKTTFI